MFPRKYRVSRDSFKKIMTEGEKKSSSLFLLRKKNLGFDFPRFSIVISKKVEKSAVKRHLLKRRFANILQKLIKDDEIKFENSDHIFILSKNVRGKEYQKILEEVRNFFNQDNIN